MARKPFSCRLHEHVVGAIKLLCDELHVTQARVIEMAVLRFQRSPEVAAAVKAMRALEPQGQQPGVLDARD